MLNIIVLLTHHVNVTLHVSSFMLPVAAGCVQTQSKKQGTAMQPGSDACSSLFRDTRTLRSDTKQKCTHTTVTAVKNVNWPHLVIVDLKLASMAGQSSQE